MKYTFLLAFCCFVISCVSPHDESKLLGEWQTVDWIVINTGENISNKMNFTFNANYRYEVDYGNQKEHGKYWISGKFLHTLEDGETEKKVKILKLTLDSLIFEMNRAGSLEKVILTKGRD